MKANPKGQFEFLDSIDISDDTKSRLASYLQLVVKGNLNTLTTPIADDNGVDNILKEWDTVFNRFGVNNSKVNSVLLDLEHLNRAKFGPRSIAKPWVDRIPMIEDYFKQRNCEVNMSNILRSMNYVRQLRPISFDKALKKLKRMTNAGLPYFMKKFRVLHEASRDYNFILSKKYPAILFTRTQEGDKTRTVWGYPIADTIHETMYYQPTLLFQEKLEWRKALLGPSHVDRAITDMLNICKYSDKFILVSADFSAYDASVSEKLIEAAFMYIKQLFQPRYWSDLNEIKDRFINIPLLTPGGIYKGRHGVPSGSTFTNEVDSVVQYLVAKSSGIHIESLQIQGDDGAYLIKETDYDTLVETFKRAGLTFNVDKSYKSKDYIIYLQNLYHKDYSRNGVVGGVYPTYRALNRILHQERFTNLKDIGLSGRDYFSIRTISILENCKYHPLFKQLVEFIYSKDKYLLEYTQEGLAKYIELSKQSQGTVGLLFNQYGDNLTGINNFETVKLLRKLNQQ